MSERSTKPVPTRKKSALQRIRQRVTKDTAAIVAFERRCLVVATFGILVALILWTVAVSTDYWFHVSPENGNPIYINRTQELFVRSHSGIWTICKFLYTKDSHESAPIRKCHNHRLFPSSEFIKANSEVDRTILDYTRTETAFAIITFCLIIMGLGFSVYTFKETRYMFKRLAAGVHCVAAAAVLVVIEVVVNSVEYEEQYLTDRHPKGAIWSYGWSFGVACATFATLLCCGITFLVCSRKRKGDRGIQQGSDDEPHILGRI